MSTRRNRLRLTREEKIRNLILRRRREADTRRRRRAERVASVVVDVSLDDILARDGSRCHICGIETYIDDRTLDHVVPLTLGGEHTPDNCRIAHRVCNSRKGKKLLSELEKPCQ
jgi:5-methylcytosine-specific restriction endonuclease McrA